MEIYTDRDGEVIFKKYSPMGEMGAVSAELAEALARTAGMSCAICDRDAVIAAAGGVKKDILERSISSELEQLMERRECYERGADEQPEVLISSQDGCAVVAEARSLQTAMSAVVSRLSAKKRTKRRMRCCSSCVSRRRSFIQTHCSVKGAFSICTGTITKSVSQRPSRSTTMRRILTRQQ